jgi:hypothetical protein
MLLQPLDITIAHKVINLTAELSGNEKRVAGAIIDSFNRKTAQCDPSLGRIARLLGINRRTVIRAVKKLETQRFIRKVRHGGKSHRNSYAPDWVRFREFEAAWSTRFKTARWNSDATKVSPIGCQSCHLGGDEGVTQTFLTNLSKEPSSIGAVSEEDKNSNKPTDRKGHPSKNVRHIDRTLSQASSSRAVDAARVAAERRWTGALHDQYAATPTVYGEIIDAIDPEMQAAATEAEIRRPGTGLLCILHELQARNTQPAVPGDDVADVTGPQRTSDHKDNS